jgi:hypothetical protein
VDRCRTGLFEELAMPQSGVDPAHRASIVIWIVPQLWLGVGVG